MVKTRLQLQGELLRAVDSHADPKATRPRAPPVYRNVFQALARIGRMEGVRGLQRGLVPAYAYQVTMNSVRFGLYADMKRVLEAAMSGGQDKAKSSLEPNMLTNVISGATAGVVSAFVGSPFFLVVPSGLIIGFVSTLVKYALNTR